MSTSTHRSPRRDEIGSPRPSDNRQVLLAAVLLGLGLGGFVDGIILHQVLQWHHMLTATGDHPADTVAGLETNTLADGMFHVATWVLVVSGTALVLRQWRRGMRAPHWSASLGLVLIGWGLFNLVEGVINHHLLTIHHVRDDVADPTWWDRGFLLSGVVLFSVGLLIYRRQPLSRARRDEHPSAGTDNAHRSSSSRPVAS